jgi:threonyl-tRNA synthetase
VQVRVLNFTDRNNKYAKAVVDKINKEVPKIRMDLDFRQTTIASKVKDAEIMRVPYIIVVGDKEEKAKNVAVRVRGSKKIKVMKLDKFIKDLSEEIAFRR